MVETFATLEEFLADWAKGSSIECTACGKPCLGTFKKRENVSACCGAEYRKREEAINVLRNLRKTERR